MARYRHMPLRSGEFRLLKLLPRKGTSELEGNILIRTLNPRGSAPENNRSPDPEAYDALSYTWDVGDIGTSIRIIDERETFSISIRPNLKAALLQLRNPIQPRYLWIDALCIDQDHNKEKSEQIPLLFQIFSRAKSVCVWIGREEQDSARAFSFIRRLMSEDFDKLVEDESLSKEWSALSNLLKRQWFSRRWIVQEIALAKSATLHCGTDYVLWDDFAYAVSLFVYGQPKIQTIFRFSREFHNNPNYLGDVEESSGARLVRVVDDIFRKTDDGRITERLLSLEQLMSTLSVFKTTDPRDVLYAILALAQDARPGFKTAFVSSEADSPLLSENHMLDAFTLHNDGFAEPWLSLKDARRGSVNTGSMIQGRKRGNSDLSEQSGASSKRPKQQPTVLHSPGQAPPASPLYGTEEMVRHSTDLILGNGDSSTFSAVPIILHGPSDDYIAALKAAELARSFTMRLRNQTKRNRICVDYDKSTLEVCRDVLNFTVSTSSSLDMICRPWAPDELLPSWLTPVTRNAFGLGHNGVYLRVNADPLVGQAGPGPSRYRAARVLPAIARFEGNSLIASGFVLGAIKEKKSAALAGVIPYEWNEAVNWTDTTKPPPDTFWRTLVGNRDPSRGLPQRLWRKACQIAFGLRPKRADLIVKEVITYESPTFVKEYLRQVLRTVWSRRLATLTSIPVSQSPCLVPQEVKKGDQVCILYGCSVPVVLREYRDAQPVLTTNSSSVNSQENFQEESSKQAPATKARRLYKVIGECYVHGMMDGEAIAYQQEKKIENQSFEMR